MRSRGGRRCNFRGVNHPDRAERTRRDEDEEEQRGYLHGQRCLSGGRITASDRGARTRASYVPVDKILKY